MAFKSSWSYFKCPVTQQMRCPVNAYELFLLAKPVMPMKYNHRSYSHALAISRAIVFIYKRIKYQRYP